MTSLRIGLAELHPGSARVARGVGSGSSTAADISAGAGDFSDFFFRTIFGDMSGSPEVPEVKGVRLERPLPARNRVARGGDVQAGIEISARRGIFTVPGKTFAMDNRRAVPRPAMAPEHVKRQPCGRLRRRRRLAAGSPSGST